MTPKRALLVIAACFVVVVGGASIAGARGTEGGPPSGQLTPQEVGQLHELAVAVSKANGGAGPRSISVVSTTRAAANALDTGAEVNIDQPVFMVSMQGQFEEHFVPPPAGLPNPTGTVLSFTYDPTADQVVDLSVGNTVPALAQLGQVTAINP